MLQFLQNLVVTIAVILVVYTFHQLQQTAFLARVIQINERTIKNESQLQELEEMQKSLDIRLDLISKTPSSIDKVAYDELEKQIIEVRSILEEIRSIASDSPEKILAVSQLNSAHEKTEEDINEIKSKVSEIDNRVYGNLLSSNGLLLGLFFSLIVAVTGLVITFFYQKSDKS